MGSPERVTLERAPWVSEGKDTPRAGKGRCEGPEGQVCLQEA